MVTEAAKAGPPEAMVRTNAAANSAATERILTACLLPPKGTCPDSLREYGWDRGAVHSRAKTSWPDSLGLYSGRRRSRPGGRGPPASAGGSRKVRTPQGRVLGNAQARRLAESATETDRP